MSHFSYKIISLIFMAFLSLNLIASELTVVPVGEATLAKDKVTINTPYKKENLPKKLDMLLNDFRSIFLNDFAFYQHKYLTVSNASDKTVDDSKDFFFLNPNYEYWKNNKTDYLVQIRSELYRSSLKIIVLVFDIRKRDRVYSKAALISNSNYRKVGHQVADEIYKLMTGRDSIFNSKIVFTSDFDSSKTDKLTTELYIMDFDGLNVRQLTHNKGIVVSPAISPDQTKVVYTLIRDARYGKRNLELHMLNLETMESTLLSDRKGINSGAAFFPDGEHIALTLSYSGNSDIYVMDLKTKSLRKLTQNGGDNVDPTIAPDGKSLAFLSSRSGKAMIYSMDTEGMEKNVKRLSFVGKFHATPDYSGDGRDIVFSSWVDDGFDIYRIDKTGSEMVRLTRNFGSNENPSFSKDSEFIIFSNQRVIDEKKALFTIYLMDRDGEILGPLSKGLGNCRAPKWSK